MKEFVLPLARRVRVLIIVVALLALAALLTAAPVLAQGPTPPTLPSLEELLSMSLLQLGTLLFTALFAYAFGYIVNAIAQRLPFEVDAKVWDVIVLVVTGAVATGWELLAGQLNMLYPGLLGTTVGGALLIFVQWVVGLATARAGGIDSARYSLSIDGGGFDVDAKGKRAIFLSG